MSRPKFQSQDARAAAELGLEPLGSPWDIQRVWHHAALFAIRLPDVARLGWDVDADVRRRLGRSRHRAYLKRTGGNLRTEVDGVVLMWDCCGQDELLNEMHYDRRGDLRPEDRAIIVARSYYHRCDSASA